MTDFPLRTKSFSLHEGAEAFDAYVKQRAEDPEAPEIERVQARMMMVLNKPIRDAINSEGERGTGSRDIANALACVFSTAALNMICSWTDPIPEPDRTRLRNMAEAGFKQMFVGYLTNGFAGVRKVDAMQGLPTAEPQGKA